MHPYIYLASQSPRRRQLLAQIGVKHELLLPDDQENAEALEQEQPGEPPDDYVRRVTLAKLAAAKDRFKRRSLPEAPILTSDTTVSIDHQILGKPRDAEDAWTMLERLSGRTHRVITAVALFDGKRERFSVSDSHVRFAPLPPEVIGAYVSSGEPFGKAGGYAIQSQIAAWIEYIDGSYSGIMGLPLFETSQLLRQAGVSF